MDPATNTPEDSNDAVSRATRLKADGDAFFRARSFIEASSRYSEAIALNPANSVLYANRGACAFAMGKFEDVIADCEEATRLDPMYVKAWARLATGLKNVGYNKRSRDAYDRALSLLPTEGLSNAEANLKQQCQEGLAEVKLRLRSEFGADFCSHHESVELPWMRAYTARREIRERTEGPQSSTSGWLLLDAYTEMRRGLDIVKEVGLERAQEDPEDQEIVGFSGALACMMTATIIDSRVLFVDTPDFKRKYNLQVELEYKNDNAFWEDRAVDVIAEAERRRAGGWSVVQPALSTTLRSWILRARMLDGLEAKVTDALEIYDEAIKVLEWAKRACRDIPEAQREDVFQKTFLRSVKCLRMECYACANRRDKLHYPLDKLHDDAKDMLRELDEAGPPDSTVRPTQRLVFYVYPRAYANVAIGWCYASSGMDAAEQNDTDSARTFFSLAAEFKLRAAREYPRDEEKYIETLMLAIEMMFFAEAYTVKDVLDVMEEVRAGVPGVERFWNRSASVQYRHRKICEMMMVESALLRAVQAGRLALESMAVRPPILMT